MTAQGKETNLLIAEDDDEDFMFFSMAVQEVEIAVALTRAENGEMLLRILEENIPDMLFLDFQMPVMSGRACLKEIRANQRYDHLPVIMYTSFSDLESIEYCFREGANLYSLKPDSLTALTEILKRILAIDWKRAMYYPTKSEFVIQPLPRV